MKYVSTRGTAPVLEFGDVLLEGLATDGGLYLPESWPPLPDLAALRGVVIQKALPGRRRASKRYV